MRENNVRSFSLYRSADRRLPARVTINWRTLHAYWLSKFVGDLPPSRRDIDPIVDIPKLTANLMLLEVKDGDFHYRVVGSRIDEICVTKMTGRQNGGEDWADRLAAAQWRSALSLVAEERQARLYFVRLPRGIDVIRVMLVLPLVNRENKTEHLLVGSFWDGYIPPGAPALELEPLSID